MKITNTDIFHLLHQKSRFLKKEMDAGLKDHQLYMSQWSILFCLHTFGAMTQTQIRKYLNVEAPTITRTLEKMASKDLIAREESNDKRERIIVMKEKAKKVYNTLTVYVSDLEADMLHAFTDDEKQQLYNLLNKITPTGE